MNQKGFIKVIVIILILLAAAAGYLYWKDPQAINKILPIKSDGTAGWKTYQNEKYGFEFRYPTNWCISYQSDSSVECSSGNPQLMLSPDYVKDYPEDAGIGFNRSALQDLEGTKGSFRFYSNQPGGGNNPVYQYLFVKNGKALFLYLTDLTVQCPQEYIGNSLNYCHSYLSELDANKFPEKIDGSQYKTYNEFIDFTQTIEIN